MPILYEPYFERVNFKMNFSKRRNFSSFEIETLLSCVEEHQSVIENKTINGATNKEKQVAWLEIEDKFNSISGVCYRSRSQLINLYKNLKRKAAKEKRDEGNEISKTGDDVLESSCPEGTNIKLMSMGICKSFKPCIRVCRSKEVCKNESISSNEIISEMACQNGNSYKETENKDKLRRRPPLKRKQPIQISSLAAAAIAEKSKVRKDLIQEEHALLMTQKKEQHELSMMHQKEEHDLKMKVLCAQLNVLNKISERLTQDPNTVNIQVGNTK